jgi:hypothetical protein
MPPTSALDAHGTLTRAVAGCPGRYERVVASDGALAGVVD